MVKAAAIENFHPGIGVRAGARLVLLSRLDEVCRSAARAGDWNDIEGVHQMRVASRRLRSALRDFSPYLRKRAQTDARARLERLAASLGQVRDCDVEADVLARLLARAQDAHVQAGIELLLGDCNSRREQFRQPLGEILQPGPMAELEVRVSQAILKATRTRDTDHLVPEVSVSTAGAAIMLRLTDEFAVLAPGFFRPFAAAPLHRMRIAAKRLRYALELFAPGWEQNLEVFAQEIAQMQTALGDLHDYDIWIARLGARMTRTAAATVQDAEAECTTAACYWLLDHFVKKRDKSYRDSLALWYGWRTDELLQRLRDALGQVRIT